MTLNYRSDDSWQTLLSHTVNDPAELWEYLELPTESLPEALQAAADFPLRVPLPYLKRIRKNDLNDPLLQQVLPLGAELQPANGFNRDPLGEMDANPLDGLVHKYRGRVLLILTGACAIHCRYCFRRHFPYQDNRLSKDNWQQLIRYLADDESIEEVILSGGDPLAVPDKRLAAILTDIEAIPHIRRLRIHSRLPAVIPQRITDSLTDRLRDSRLKTLMVLHINHAQEIDQQITDAVSKLTRAGIQVLNQAVVLKGINDTVSAQKALSETLFDAGILPYYLFVLDRVEGAAHFEVDETQVRKMMGELASCLPGYLVPKLAREIAGQSAKTQLPPIFS